MSFFGNKRLIIVLVGLVLLISLVGFTSREREKLTWPEMFLKDTFSLVQGLLYRPAQAFSGFIKDIGDAYNVYQENRSLKASMDEYAQVTAELKIEKAENDRLRALLQAKTNLHDYQFRFAEVIARNSDNWNNVLTIDKGLQHGIKKDMAVMMAKGLIGRVKSVANFSSTVELLTDIERNNHISAYVITQQTVNGKTAYEPVTGVIEEYDAQAGMLVMRKIPWGKKIEPKQQVITSGLGGIFPRNLPIGNVVRVQPDDYGLTQTAYIQTSADFSQISEVMVVERAYTLTPSGDLVPNSQTNNAGQPKSPSTSQIAPNDPSGSGSGGGH